MEFLYTLWLIHLSAWLGFFAGVRDIAHEAAKITAIHRQNVCERHDRLVHKRREAWGLVEDDDGIPTPEVVFDVTDKGTN